MTVIADPVETRARGTRRLGRCDARSCSSPCSARRWSAPPGWAVAPASPTTRWPRRSRATRSCPTPGSSSTGPPRSPRRPTGCGRGSCSSASGGRAGTSRVDRARDPRASGGGCATSSRGGSASPSGTSSRTGAGPPRPSRSPSSTRRVRSCTAPPASVATREPIRISWALVLTPRATGTRLHLRLRISALGRRAPRLMTTVAGLIDEATVAPLFAGLAERVG